MVNKKQKDYEEFLEHLKTEVGEFLQIADTAVWTRKGRIALKARKKSLQLRKLLKEFRGLSIENEKEIKSKENKFNGR